MYPPTLTSWTISSLFVYSSPPLYSQEPAVVTIPFPCITCATKPLLEIVSRNIMFLFIFYFIYLYVVLHLKCYSFLWFGVHLLSSTFCHAFNFEIVVRLCVEEEDFLYPSCYMQVSVFHNLDFSCWWHLIMSLVISLYILMSFCGPGTCSATPLNNPCICEYSLTGVWDLQFNTGFKWLRGSITKGYHLLVSLSPCEERVTIIEIKSKLYPANYQLHHNRSHIIFYKNIFKK